MTHDAMERGPGFPFYNDKGTYVLKSWVPLRASDFEPQPTGDFREFLLSLKHGANVIGAHGVYEFKDLPLYPDGIPSIKRVEKRETIN